MVKAGFLEVTIDTRGMAGRFDADQNSLAFLVFSAMRLASCRAVSEKVVKIVKNLNGQI